MFGFLCSLGYHTGPWVITVAGACDQHRICTRCNTTERRMVHDFQVPPDGRVTYVSDEDCQARGECTRCGRLGDYGLAIVHRWGDYQHRWNDDSELEAIQFCRHCPAYRVRPSVPVEFMDR